MLQVEQSTVMEDTLQATAIQVTQALIGTSGSLINILFQ